MTTEPPNGGDQTYEQVGGRYELWGLLGRGGMAEVRAGKDLRLGRRVAVKLLRADLASDPTFQARFRREAQSAASLNHPAIVAVYDTGDEDSGDGTGLRVPYIVMEQVEGRTLREILREGRKILPERALEITAGVLAALDYSHRAGIIHRDIKPANVMLTPNGDVKVMDFGIARAIADSSSAMTQTAAVVGTAQYLSPEQARGEQVDARSDIYSTGCLLYELLTGRPPFVGDSPVSVAYQHVREEAPAPSSIDPELAPELDAIAAKSLAKSTTERYQSAAEMRADIERALAGQQVNAPAVLPAADNPPVLPMTDDLADETAYRDDEPRRGRGWLYALLVLAVVAIFALLGWLVPKWLDGTEATPKATVPTLTGLTEAEARDKLEAVNLQIGKVTPQASNDVEQGLVISQDPDPEVALDEGEAVDIVVSSGRKQVEVPNVVGDDIDAATTELEDLGLKVDTKKQPGGDEKNQVVEMDPEAGSRLRVGQTVTLTISEGPLEVPDVVGNTEELAKRKLERVDLQVQVVDDPGSDEDAGIVTSQTPDAGEQVQPGDTVIITVSTKPEDSETPTDEPTEPTETPTDEPTEPTETPTDGGIFDPTPTNRP
ncbi:MAG: Stk1 family PASTA domain-containing Ser/Thr kinase [Nocardioidaceae bacterium]